MDRKGYRLKRATRCSVPGVVFAVEVYRAVPIRQSRRGIRIETWHSARVSVCYRRRDKWSAVQTAWVSTPEALREWMDERAHAGRTNWVIADSAPEVLTLSEWWQYAERIGISHGRARKPKSRVGTDSDGAGGVRIEQLATSDRCGIITYVERGVRWRWVSASNYWPDGADAERGGLVHGRVSGVRRDRAGERRAHRESAPRVSLLERFTVMCEWWRRIASAPLGCTAGQLAHGILRSTDGCRELVTHNCDTTLRLERSAAHGGRASVWYSGRIAAPGEADSPCDATDLHPGRARCIGPVTRVDVSSMYPTLLRDRLYPCRAIGLYGAIPVPMLMEFARAGNCIARVRVRTTRGEFPLRRDDDVIYPTGEFVTTLTAPELVALSECGEVVSVAQCATYAMGRPFRESMERLLDARAEAKARGDRDAEAFSKLCANSLAGKLAQRAGGWVRSPQDDCPGAWGEWYKTSSRTMTVARFRHVAGAAWEWTDDKTGRGPHTAAFAFLAAYGRAWMKCIRDRLPECSVVSQDTDGLFLLPCAAQSQTVAEMTAREGPGRLRVVGTRDSAQFWGPRHYLWGDEWTLSGYQCPVVRDGRESVYHMVATPLWDQRDRSAPSTVLKRTLVSAFPLPSVGGRVQPDGWILPHHIIPGKRPEGE